MHISPKDQGAIEEVRLVSEAVENDFAIEFAPCPDDVGYEYPNVQYLQFMWRMGQKLWRPLRMGTMFSGIGAPEEACRQLGLDVELAWYAEIEAAQSAVLAHHHPDAVNLGDITRPDFVEMATARGAIDVVFGGPPCQPFSSAGKKGGIADPRGMLSLIYCNHLDAIAPKLAFLENVKELLGNPTNPMGHILPRLAGEQDIVLAPPNGRRWPNAGVVEGSRRLVAWRLFDAVHWGPEKQRRERVYMCAAERSSGIDPTAILFD